MKRPNLWYLGASTAVFSLLLFAVFRPDRNPELAIQVATLPARAPAEVEAPAVLDAFGFSNRAYEVTTHRIERGDTYAGLLLDAGLSPEARLALEQEEGSVLRNVVLRAGNDWHVYQKNGVPSHVIYEVDPRQYVVISLGDAPQAKLHAHPVQYVERKVTGTINNSLYATLDAAGASGDLAPALASIFGAQVDFYRLQKGDELALVFEEERIGDRAVGAGTVIAARLIHEGRTYEAYRFEHNGKAGYYDAEGKSLENGFLKSPLKFSRMTSGFTMRRFHPVQKRWKAHLGTDYAAPTGTPILAVGDGVVTQASFNRGNGNFVKIRHDRTYETQYLHMSRFAKGVRPGTRVQKGDVIGYVGSTGLATGPHVCFRFWKNGVQVDHRKELGPEMPPIDADLLPVFAQQRDRIAAQLAPKSILEPVRRSLFTFDAAASPLTTP